ncbi:MAG: hypothetical protein SVY15_07860 [Halobacteriota archaeon]|nr:hypothetical protein [Halobacteriota archaeon]
MSEHRDDKIMDTLKKYGVIRRCELIKETGLTTGSISRGIKSLEKRGLLISRKIGYNANIALPEYKDKLTEMEKNEHLKKTGNYSDTDLQLKIRHADDIRDKVIKPWLNQIPDVSAAPSLLIKDDNSANSSVHVISEYVSIWELERPFKLSLPVEEEPLFEDLQNHKGFKEFLGLWRDFKESIDRLDMDKKNSLKKITTDLTSEIGRAMQIKLEMNSKIGVSEAFSPYLPEWLYRGSLAFAEGDLQTFKEWWVYPESTTKIEESSIVYKIGHDEFIRISKELLDEADFRKRCDGVLKKMIEKVKNDYYKDFFKIIEDVNKIKKERDELIHLLKKQLSHVVFDGDCEYIS